VYVALHLFGGLEVRKYAPDRSVIFDSVVPACGPGSVSVSGIAADRAGHVWIAGNTTACLTSTESAWKQRVSDVSRPHGFVLRLDASKPAPSAPLYLTYLADPDNWIFGLRIDAEGNAYVAGSTSSADFPHQSRFDVNSKSLPARTANLGFVAALNPSGSGLQWSALIENADLAALALDATGNVYVAGRTGDDALLAELSDRGKKLSYVSRLGKGEARAVAVAGDGSWAVVQLESSAVAVQPCGAKRIGSIDLPRTESSIGTEVAMQLALDAFAKAFSPPGVSPCPSTPMARASACCGELEFAGISLIRQ
jgi:hypothetical protein